MGEGVGWARSGLCTGCSAEQGNWLGGGGGPQQQQQGGAGCGAGVVSLLVNLKTSFPPPTRIR